LSSSSRTGLGMIDAKKVADKYNAKLRQSAIEEETQRRDAEEIAKKTISSQSSSPSWKRYQDFTRRSSGRIGISGKEEGPNSCLMTRKPRESAEDFLAALIPSIERKYLTEQEIARSKSLCCDVLHNQYGLRRHRRSIGSSQSIVQEARSGRAMTSWHGLC